MAKYDEERDVVIIEEIEFSRKNWEDICMRADYLGMDSLTEQEQYLLDVWHNRRNLEAA